jgi:hypothetical protein
VWQFLPEVISYAVYERSDHFMEEGNQITPTMLNGVA